VAATAAVKDGDDYCHVQARPVRHTRDGILEWHRALSAEPQDLRVGTRAWMSGHALSAERWRFRWGRRGAGVTALKRQRLALGRRYTIGALTERRRCTPARLVDNRAPDPACPPAQRPVALAHPTGVAPYFPQGVPRPQRLDVSACLT
jgi:hypothetical protein